MRYLTYTCQKDGRYLIGTTVHSNIRCSALKNKPGKIMKVTGEILKVIPKCRKCNRS